MEMELLLVISSLLLAVLSFLSFGRYGRSEGKSFNLPPGTMGWPLIGHTIPFLQPHPSASLGRFVDQQIAKYGRVFKIKFLGKPTVVSADPELNRFILQSEGREFENSCAPSTAEIMGHWSMLALVGDIHREMRAIAVGFMSNAKLRTYFLPDVERQALNILNSWKHNSTFSAQDEAKKFAFNLMVKHMMSMNPEMPETEQLRKEYFILLKGMNSIPLNLPGTGYRKGLKSRYIMLNIMGKQLDERVKKIEGGGLEEGDLLASVAKHSDLTREQILDLILSMLFAGHETTSAAISLAMYYLTSCPKAVKQLQEEHGEISRLKKEQGETGLNWEDYKQMEFTHCVINETLRMGNIIKFVNRRAIKDVHFKGYDIPCGWEVVPILAAAHLDPSIYDDPQTYNPWRWKKMSATMSKNNNVMAFSGGPRMCPGAELAKLEIAVFLHHLVQKYEWELVEKEYPISSPLLEFPKLLPIRVKPLK